MDCKNEGVGEDFRLFMAADCGDGISCLLLKIRYTDMGLWR